jgi:hypothetical protein
LVRRLSETTSIQAEAAAPRLEWLTAGAALLLRTVLDIRLPAQMSRAVEDIPNRALSAWLAGLLLRLSTPEVGLPSGLAAVCSLSPTDLDELPWVLASLPLAPLENAWLETLIQQRALDPTSLHLFCLSNGKGSDLLFGGDASGTLLPLGTHLPSTRRQDALQAILVAWLENWKAATGVKPALFTTNGELFDSIQNEPILRSDFQLIDQSDPDLLAVHHATMRRLAETWQTLSPGAMGMPEHDLLLGRMAAGLLRLWARWLRNFSGASTPYLLAQFIHRPGVVIPTKDEVVIELEPRPLDIVLEMAGYFEPLERLPWLDGRRLAFQRR